MDREQIEKWRAEADAHANTIHPLLPEYPRPGLSAILNWQRDHRAAGDDHFARLAWNAALEEAKAKCIQVSERYMETDFYKHAELQSNAVVGASDCADAIDELKEPQP